MTTHAYRRARAFDDLALVAALGVAAWALPHGPLATALLVAIPAVLAWGAITLHFPARVDVSEAGIVFSRYGREHRFAWGDVARVRVRRFLVRDRVLVALAPSSAWRGKYWILDSIDGFDSLVSTLEAIARARRG